MSSFVHLKSPKTEYVQKLPAGFAVGTTVRYEGTITLGARTSRDTEK